MLAAAAAADVDTVMVDGRVVVQGGRHVMGDAAAAMRAALGALWEGI